nr:hypothetical protein [Tanacetum cinerariifolium]
MSLTFADTHNMVAYLTKSEANASFNQVIDFLNASYIKLQALVDKKKVVITETTIRDALRLAMASAVICLSTGRKFNFSKYIFESLEYLRKKVMQKSRFVGNKMHKAFPLLVRKFPLPEGTSHCLKKKATARRKEMPLPEDCTAATKKTKKNLLKQRYGNFRAEGSETLEQRFSRLFAPEWLMHTIVWRNMSDLDTMSLDDLYNHLKVYELEVHKKSEPNTHNMAFISSAKHSRGNDEVNTASVYTASSNVPTASANVATVSISQETACAYIASQSSGSQIKFKDINEIDVDDMEEMNIKWNMSLLSMRADKMKSSQKQDRGRRDTYRQGSKAEEQAPKALMAIDGVGWDWSYMSNNEEDHALVADEEAPTEFALMANTSTESKVFDNSLCSKDCKKNNDSINSKITDLTNKLFNANNMIYHYKLALAQVESRLVEYKQREVKYIEKIKTLEYYNEGKKECIESLKKEIENLKKEKEVVDGKLAGLLTATKDLDNLIESQRSDKSKEGLGYTTVPPPTAQLYLSPKKDLSWTGLPECADDTVTDYSKPSPTIESSSEEDQNKNPSASENVTSPITPKQFVKFVKASDSQSKKSPTDPQRYNSVISLLFLTLLLFEITLTTLKDPDLSFHQVHEHYALWEVIEFGDSYKVPTNTDQIIPQREKTMSSLEELLLLQQKICRGRRMMNDLDSMSLDDLYNHLKVYEAEVQKKSNSNSHNMAFISSSKNSIENEDGILTASKDLDNLIESQRSDKSKKGLGYTAVPPPTAQLYLSPKKD